MERMEANVNEVTKKIQATSSRILLAVKKWERDLYEMLRTIHDQKSVALKSERMALENDLAQVFECCDFADALEKTGDVGMILQANEMTCAKLRELCEK